MVLHAELEYSSSGCNRIVGNLCCGIHDIYAYGSHNAVVLYDTQRNRVAMTLLGHNDVVTSVAWVSDVESESKEHCLVSGSADGDIIFWNVHLDLDQNRTCPWKMVQRFDGHHRGPVTCVAVDILSSVVVTTGGDGCVTIISSRDGEYCEEQRLSFGTKLVHCAAITRVNQGSMLLAMGFVDGSVQVYASSGDEMCFSLACNLSGHQNWIRGIDFAHIEGDRILLATGSQDRYVRVWSIDKTQPDHSVSLDSLGITKYAPKPRIHVGDESYDIILESLLVGHEDWVMSVAWNTTGQSKVVPLAELTLLSSSMDRTMILWKRDISSGIWMSSEVVGDAGINHLGYYTCMWGRGGTSIATHGYTGALHIWDRCGEGVDKSLLPRTSGSGHMSEVVDSSWARDGSFLLTVSSDQTARVFTSCKSEQSTREIWCEIARPQIHGHDFSCVSVLKSHDGMYRYTSGSEEKVLRVFESPVAFLDTLLVAKGHDVEMHQSGKALGAKLPALGLSNKAIVEDSHGQERPDGSGTGPEGYDDGADLAPTSAPSVVTCPPLEEHLSQNTLWPETNKLYGHGNDLFCVASDPKGRFLASASRAQSASTAGIIIWDTTSWTQICTLDGHSLTVTCLEFSPCGEFLASVGRDRKLCVFKTHSTGFSRICTIKAHSRVLWSVAWSPDSNYIFTCSRDLTIKCWHVQGNGTVEDTPAASVTCSSGPRALASIASADSVLLAAGSDDGRIEIFAVKSEQAGNAVAIDPVFAVPAWLQHAGAVRSVLWKPSLDSHDTMTLSSVGDDYSVKIWTIHDMN